MAKKGARQVFALICTVCKSQNYLSEKNKLNTLDKVELKRYCPRCRKHQLHKESSKLK